MEIVIRSDSLILFYLSIVTSEVFQTSERPIKVTESSKKGISDTNRTICCSLAFSSWGVCWALIYRVIKMDLPLESKASGRILLFWQWAILEVILFSHWRQYLTRAGSSILTENCCTIYSCSKQNRVLDDYDGYYASIRNGLPNEC